jgi:hypothetical protein
VSLESRLVVLEEAVYGVDYSENDLSLISRVDVLERRVHELERPRITRQQLVERASTLEHEELEEAVECANRLCDLLGLGRR